MAIVVVQAKSTQKWYFLVLKPILNFFYIFIPQPFLCKRIGSKKASPPTRCQFQRPLRVGLSLNSFCETQKALSVLMSFPLCYFIATNKIFTKGKYINSCYLLCILILTKDADGFDLKFLGLYLSKNKFPSNVV